MPVYLIPLSDRSLHLYRAPIDEVGPTSSETTRHVYLKCVRISCAHDFCDVHASWASDALTLTRRKPIDRSEPQAARQAHK